ncbi:DUF4268 domain-containing protein [Winogradskyella haliclonae]|uniref:DUF4268 domain-containing protein n=1 Tax=Winogradskyella haliclonae TaxID=2048558 RepID=A0ABQ2BWL0_9FLAO|nr:DUF4268 domain-containing protein [Winogradskyella haliclonae]GGI56113.1 hypothetical protein GCM10011444_04220 [Winogradskyella haliclonae]
MFLINKETNRIERIQEKTFSELKFKERDNLQEWLANNPSSLGEDLLIIQKEFAGFNDTRERLDLLALDKQGNLVIIENKLDDTGRDVTWQVLKYASYCSSLSKSQIIKIYQDYLVSIGESKNAEEALSEFFDGQDIEEIFLNKGTTQRVILVAGNYRKEVTSTILWLLNYNLRIQCFKVTPFQLAEQLILNVEQIIPMKEAEEYAIKMAEKTQDDISAQEELKSRHIVRIKFWTQLIKAMNQKSKLYQNISPGKYNWIGAGSGVRGVGFNFAASKNYGRAELYIDRGDKEENEFVFNELLKHKESLEAKIGQGLEWEYLETKRACRIKLQDSSFDIFKEELWPEAITFMTDSMVKLEKAIQPHLNTINKKLKAFN